MTEGTRKRMTLLEQATVTQWMTENADTVSTWNPDDLAYRIKANTGVTLTPASAARHRKGCGLAPEKPARKERPARVNVDTRLVAIEQRLCDIEQLLIAKKATKK